MITKTRLVEFGRRHPQAMAPLRAWARVMRRKRYRHHLEVRHDFPHADFVGPHRAVFNICGNEYRLVVDLRYDLGRVYVRHVVTHAVYLRLSRRGGL
ncbi:MAG: type II toxin-antitoxin system HigB family toxin [Gemmatimonadaceae bacterium]